MKRVKDKNRIYAGLACVFAAFTLVLAVGVGSVSTSPAGVISVILNQLFGRKLPESVDASIVSIVWEIRMPRVFTAFFAGALLSVSGAIVQSLLQNPLASSYTLGVSSGASLGAGIIIALEIQSTFLSFLLLPVTGFVFGLGTVLLVIFFSSRLDGNLKSHTIILFGMITSLFTNACLTLVSAIKSKHMQRLILWQMGSFAGRRWTHVGILATVCVIGCIFVFMFHKQLDLMSFGDETAQGVGVDTKKGRIALLILASILTGCAVCFTGVIGFIDLAAPHAVRRIFGPSHKYVIPMSGLLGGAFMILADFAARMVLSPQEIPVGAVTALLGAPFFLWIYFGSGKKYKRK